MRKTFAALAAAALVLGVGGTASAAQTSAAPTDYVLCVNKKTSAVRMGKCNPKVEWSRLVPNSNELRIPVNSPAERGATGAQGVQGERGLQGPKGDTGARGWQGWRGQTGPRGPVGPTGPKGDAGAPGKNGGVVVLETLGLDLSAFGVPGITKIMCSDNTSSDPANPAFSKCVKKVTATPSATPSPTPTLTPVPGL